MDGGGAYSSFVSDDIPMKEASRFVAILDTGSISGNLMMLKFGSLMLLIGLESMCRSAAAEESTKRSVASASARCECFCARLTGSVVLGGVVLEKLPMRPAQTTKPLRRAAQTLCACCAQTEASFGTTTVLYVCTMVVE